MRYNSPLVDEFMETGKCASCPVIDMHGHYGPLSTIYMPRCYGEGMLESMDSAGVKAIICSHHEAIMRDVVYGNQKMKEAVDKYKGRIFGYWAFNPNYPDVIAEDLKNYKRGQGFVGFKFLADYHEYPLTGENYKPVLEYAEKNEMCIMLHTWGCSPCDGPKLVRQLAERYPRVTFMMAHSGYGEWDESISIVKKFPNVYLDITSTYTTHWGIKLRWTDMDFGVGVSGIIERMVNEVGSERILFGTDMPWFNPHYAIGAVLFSHLSNSDIHNILHRNAEKILAKQGFKI